MEEQEIWKSVKSYFREGVDTDHYRGAYEVSNFGRIRNVKDPCREPLMLKPSPNSCGYYRVNLNVGGIDKAYLVHRLVMFAFAGSPPLKSTEVNHIDVDLKNNRLENLTYCTHEENRTHSVVHRLQVDRGLYRQGYYAVLSSAPDDMTDVERVEYFSGVEQAARYCKVNSKRKIDKILAAV